MQYTIVLASFPLANGRPLRSIGCVPGTEVTVIADPTDNTRQVYEGYLQLRQHQLDKPVAKDDPLRVTLAPDEPEIKKLEEAINLYMLFDDGMNSRDNVLQVVSIEPHQP